jgi:rhodanese-related sulfurtransferase
MREVAQEHLVELRVALEEITSNPDKLASVSREQFMDQARRGEIVVIDVRPRDEYAVAHLPFARSMPLAEVEQHLASLPLDKEIVAYCRGPFCLLSNEAVALLQARGYRARKVSDGVSEWQCAGLPLERQVG